MDSDAGTLCVTFVFLILLFINFILVAFVTALDSVTDTELEDSLSKETNICGGLLELKERYVYVSRSAWLIQVLFFLTGGMFFLTVNDYVPVYITALILSVIFYLFGFSLPEMAGHKDPAVYLQKKYKMVKGVLLVLFPVTYVMTAVSNCCVRIFGIDPDSLGQEVTEDEIISMVNEGYEQGVLDDREAEMIQNIFELDDKNAGNIMTHRKNIIGISGTVNLNDAIEFMVGESVSRFPVYEDNIDNIIGVLHFKDAMKFHTRGMYDCWLIKDIPGLLREIRFIPETRGIDVLFRNMQAEKLQMVMVVDEYGQTAGLVTMEDILEEIVGNIQDEYDDEVPLIRQEDDGVYFMDGMAPLSDALDILGFTLEDDEYDTLNGLLISRLGRIPSDGEKADFTENGYLFQILEVEDKMIRLVKITKLKEEEKE